MSANHDRPVLVNRSRAAFLLGLKPGTLRAWSATTPRRGPPFVKMGDNKQSHAYYLLSDIERFAADPKAFERQTP
jgi:hypothetical protein